MDTATSPGGALYMRPAWKGSNPYTAILADTLVAEGFDVREMNYSGRAYPTGPGIVMLHWPNEFFRLAGPADWRRALALLAKGWIGRRRGQKLVWVAHNLVPHDGAGGAGARSSRASRAVLRAFLSDLDGIISISATSRRMLLERYPQLAGVPHVVVGHGDYRARAIRPPTLPPTIAGSRPVALAFTGHVRAYKAPDLLARLVTVLPAGAAELVIAGECDAPALTATLTTIAVPGGPVRLDLVYQSDAALEAVVDGADAVVLPYRDIVNSGSALLALSRARPVIAPRLGALEELQEQVGADWVWLYDGTLTAATLADGVQWARTTARTAMPDLSAHDWTAIGATLARFLRGL